MNFLMKHITLKLFKIKPAILFCIVAVFATFSCNKGCVGGKGLFSETKKCSNSFPIVYTSTPNGFKAIALAEDGIIWQWAIGKPDAIASIQKIKIDDVMGIDKMASLAGVLPFPFSGLALQRNGKIKVWDINNPQAIEEVKTEEPVRKMSCGYAHVLLLNENGTITGLGDEASYFGLKSLKNVVDIAAGLNYSIACTQEGKVYVTGMNIGNYIAPGSTKNEIINAYEISGLSHIVKVGTTNTQNHYAVDNLGNMYVWDVHTHVKNQPIQRISDKALFVFYDAFYLNANLKIKARPEFKNNSFVALDFETDEKFQNAVFVESFNKKYYLIVNRDGYIFVYEGENYYAGRNLRSKIVKEEQIPGLRIDVCYFSSNVPGGKNELPNPNPPILTQPEPKDSTPINPVPPPTTPPTTPEPISPFPLPGVVHTKGSPIRLRSEPSDTAHIIKLIPNNSKVKVLGEDGRIVIVDGESGKWQNVEHEGDIGWAWGKFILRKY